MRDNLFPDLKTTSTKRPEQLDYSSAQAGFRAADDAELSVAVNSANDILLIK